MKQIKFAFFDVDGTLIRIKSMFSFHEFWYCLWRSPTDNARLQEYQDVSAKLYAIIQSGARRELINRRYYEFFAGRSVKEVMECAQAWYEHVQTETDVFIQESLLELLRLRKIGYEPVLVSGSFKEILLPIAKQLGVNRDYVLATELASDGGTYTGKILKMQMIGAGKATAIQNFLTERDASAQFCYAFGDDISDLPMLETVGSPNVIEGDDELESIARERKWRIIRLNRFLDDQNTDPYMLKKYSPLHGMQ